MVNTTATMPTGGTAMGIIFTFFIKACLMALSEKEDVLNAAKLVCGSSVVAG